MQVQKANRELTSKTSSSDLQLSQCKKWDNNTLFADSDSDCTTQRHYQKTLVYSGMLVLKSAFLVHFDKEQAI